ncbi:MAG: GAF domain-containing protein [Myxococcota bacterium]
MATDPPRAPSLRFTSDVNQLQLRNEKLSALLDVAKALIEEHTIDPLLDLIMAESARTVDAERCSLFIMGRDGKELWSKIAHGLSSGQNIIRLPVGQGIAGQVAQTGRPLNIPDAYADPRFNRAVDVSTGYHTKTILCVPMMGRDRVVGVVQALNHRDGPFSDEDEELLMALGAMAAAAIENANLYEDIEKLFEGFVTASVTAIEARDPTTSGHSERVAMLSVVCFEALPRSGTHFLDVRITPKEMRELRYAALLHDFGKVGVREHVLVKAEKLYPHELDLMRARFREARQQAELEMLRARLELVERSARADREAALKELETKWRARDAELREMLEFVEACNRPTVLERGGFERLKGVADTRFTGIDGRQQPLLSAGELLNLQIPRGSLNDSERKEIESHVVHTFNFLKQIPWTRELSRIPEIAGGHHEKLDGTGYPRGLHEDVLPLQTRIMTIADIYDALTASDRPYKAAMPHHKALEILEGEAKRSKIDRRLLDVFIEADVPGTSANMRSAGQLSGEFAALAALAKR